ncbi:hypothetical protein MXD81_14415, partial [Microbacteriaceae bacterium K1510]|nr:hypothetical protein [Microbacteriaceae bacterium K1510]
MASDDNIYGKGAKRELPETAVLREHVARKATAIWQIVPTIKAELAANQMEKLLDDLEGPTSLVLAKMERLGVKVEGDRLNQMGQDLDEKLEKLTAKIYELAGVTFNIN